MSDAPATGAERAKVRREQHLAKAQRAKTLLTWVSVLALGAFAGLAASHVTGVTSRLAGTPRTPSSSTGTTGTQVPGAGDSQSFFNQAPQPAFGTSSGSPVTSTGAS